MRIILFTGKGGSGVSTLAAATAAAIADAGKRTLAFGLGEGLGAALGERLTHEPRQVAPNLDALEGHRAYDEPDEFRDWLEELLDFRGIEAELASDLAALPGANLIGRMLELARHTEGETYEVVVVDAIPLGQFLNIPPSLDAAAHWLDRLFDQRQSNVFEPLVRMFAADYAAAGEDVLEQGQELLGRLADLRESLTDSQTSSVRIVLPPDDTAVATAQDAMTALGLYSYALDAVIAARTLPEEVSDAYFASQKRRQAAVIKEIAGSLQGIPVLQSSLRPSQPRGTGDLLEVARALYGERDPGAVFHEAEGHSFEASDSGYLMTLLIPFAKREQLAVEQLEDGVAVHVNGRRCVINLPEEVEVREAASWSFEPPRLSVTFRR